ncbi:hypothetical protein EYF80_041997 [Liparis tanakae]|uniref:Uncharacterized protein n=1 Tax=Liparis tanakae TaxID=230148 RepID=A0A4Z2G3Q0_9TELE|nr:hypothetical protein EYF80_041997 [Liparis tanakae]
MVVRQPVEAQRHAEGVDVLLQGLVLVVQAPGRFQQLVQVVLRLLDGALHLGGQEGVFQKYTEYPDCFPSSGQRTFQLRCFSSDSRASNSTLRRDLIFCIWTDLFLQTEAQNNRDNSG